MKKLRVGFIGLGLMGKPMAMQIYKAGFPLCVYNRSSNKTADFKKLDVTTAKTPKDLALQSDVVVTMVTGPKDVKTVLFGKHGVIEGAHENLTVIDMSTIGVLAAKEIGKNLQSFGISFLDAPVTGSVMRAKTGELTIFIGGKKEVFENVAPVLSAMGKTLCFIGQTGTGQAIKLINNHLVAVTISGLAEAMVLADKLGISRNIAADALSNTPAFSPFMQLKLKNMTTNDFTTAFSVSNMHKDLKLALLEIKKTKKHLPVLSLVEKLFAKAKAMGYENKDISSVLAVLAS